MVTDGVTKEFFIKYLRDFSQRNPTELKIIVIDNASFHSTKDIEITKEHCTVTDASILSNVRPCKKNVAMDKR